MIEKRIRIKPSRPGLIVRRFDKKGFPKLKEEGEWVRIHPQWMRFLKAGDVVLAQEAPKEKPKKSKGDDK